MQKDMPVMAHDKPLPLLKYPSVVQWLELILKFLASGKKIGIKLDFKDPLAVESCLAALAKSPELMQSDVPVWLNADILTGPRGSTCKFNPIEFIRVCKVFYTNHHYQY
jgi:hypothetical protein